MTEGPEPVLGDGDLTDEDRAALGWALQTDHPLGVAIARRVWAGTLLSGLVTGAWTAFALAEAISPA